MLNDIKTVINYLVDNKPESIHKISWPTAKDPRRQKTKLVGYIELDRIPGSSINSYYQSDDSAYEDLFVRDQSNDSPTPIRNIFTVFSTGGSGFERVIPNNVYTMGTGNSEASEEPINNNFHFIGT